MARLRDIGDVSAGEMVRAVMAMIADGENPRVLPAFDGKKPLDIRQRRVAERYLAQFDPVKLEKCIKEQLDKYAPGKTLMEFIIEERFAQVCGEKTDSAKLNALAVLEKICVVLAACHPQVAGRLNCRSVSHVSGATGSPFGDQVRRLRVSGA